MGNEEMRPQSLTELLPELFQQGSDSGQQQEKYPPEYTLSSSEELTMPVQSEEKTAAKTRKTPTDEIQEVPDYNFDGYQVVRGEFFSHINEPSVTLCDGKISFNQACFRKAPETEFVLVLVNPETKIMVVMPSLEETKDSFKWKTDSGKTRQVSCKIVIGMIVHMMSWRPEYRYKMIGKMIRSNGQLLFAFDLKSAEIYQRSLVEENGKTRLKASRRPTYSEDWKDHFGVSFEEHKKALQISIFDKYVVFNVNETPKGFQKKTETEDSAE